MFEVTIWHPDGTMYAQRRWSSVPRIGETVMVKDGEGGAMPLIVTEVIYTDIVYNLTGEGKVTLKTKWKAAI